jgi:hypothetical protein
MSILHTKYTHTVKNKKSQCDLLEAFQSDEFQACMRLVGKCKDLSGDVREWAKGMMLV